MSLYGNDQHESYPFISILNQILSKSNPIRLWDDSTTDFIHIKDVVDCVYNKINIPTDIKLHVINLTTGIYNCIYIIT